MKKKYILKFPKLHKLQQEIVNDRSRFKIVICGRRWGKTRMCAIIALMKAIEGKRTWWIAPDYDTTEIGWREVSGLVKQLPIPYNIKNSFPKEINFPETKGFVKFRSADSFGRGEGLDYIIVDEADFIDGVGKIGAANSGKIWNEKLRPSLMDRKGGAIFITTPNIENGWIHRLFQQAASGVEKSSKCWQLSSYTNPFLDPKEIDEMKIDMPNIVFRREIMAEFVSTSGSRIRREWLIDRYVEDITNDDLKNMWVSMGIDLAVSEKETADYTAYAILGRDKNGYVYVIDVQRRRISSFQKQIEFLKQAMDRWNPNSVGVESVGYQDMMARELSLSTNYTIIPVKVTKDKITRFSPLEARYERKEVFHSRSLSPEFENELFSFPNSEHDDQIDALSCAWAVIGNPVEDDTSDTKIYIHNGMNIEMEDININDVINSNDGDILNDF